MDTPHAYVWRLQNFVLGEHILTPSTQIQAPVKACTISSCGNFDVLGTAGGWIEKFNLQSGMTRGSYVDMSEKTSCAHDGEVAGVACDATNSLMISAGYNGDVKLMKLITDLSQSSKFHYCNWVKYRKKAMNPKTKVITGRMHIERFLTRQDFKGTRKEKEM